MINQGTEKVSNLPRAPAPANVRGQTPEGVGSTCLARAQGGASGVGGRGSAVGHTPLLEPMSPAQQGRPPVLGLPPKTLLGLLK